MRIAMVFDGLQTGGIERVGADYARILVDAGHDVTIVNLRPNLNAMEQEFPVSCSIVHFDYKRKLVPEQYNKVTRIWSWGKFAYPVVAILLSPINILLKVICRLKFSKKEKYDLAIAFSGHFNDLNFVANKFINANHLIGWMHGALYSYVLLSGGFLNLYKKIYNIIALVETGQEEVLLYNNYLNLNINKLYNPSFIFEKQINDKEVVRLKNKYGKYILMVSRFNYPHKDPYTLIDAFTLFYDKHKDLNLVFVGDGPDKANAVSYAKKKGTDVASHIFFEGEKLNTQDYYKSAFMLVQSSCFEGLPTTLIEALYFNLPIISSDCPTGPREILGNNEYGLLCEVRNSEDMAQQIISMYEDEELYKCYKEKSKERIVDFMPNTIQAKFFKIIGTIEGQEE